MLKVHKPDTYLNIEDTSSHTYIVNFAKVFEINIQYPLMKDLNTYQVTKKLDKNARAFFYHHIVLGLCQYILNQSVYDQGRIVIYNHIGDLNKSELYEYYTESVVKELVSDVLASCKRHLPIRIHDASFSFYYFLGSTGGAKEGILAQIRDTGSKDFEKYTFNKAIKFANKHGLIFLSRQYFDQLKTKQLLFC